MSFLDNYSSDPLNNDPAAMAYQSLPVAGVPKPTTYIMEPDLVQTQTGKLDVPKDVSFDDAGAPYNNITGQPVKVIRRPNVLPVAMTPEGPTFAMPKMLDVVGNVMSPLAAGRVPVKAGEMVLGSGAVRTVPEVIETAAKAEPFYSTLEQAVSNAKIGKADASQWLGYLKNQPGVKSEEINTVLSNLPEGQITKEALQGIVKDNAVKLNEVVKGTDDSGLKIQPSKEHEGEWDVVDSNGRVRYSGTERSHAEEYINEETQLNPKTNTKYHDYQLPGGENYKEMLSTLPDKQQRLYQWEYFDPKTQTSKQFATEAEAKAAAPQGAVVQPKEVQTLNENYKSSHWDEPNILAHIRMNDRNIPDVGKSLHLEEIQSDWHQAGRKEGYIQKDLPQLKANADAVDQKLIDAKAEDIMGNPDLKAGLKDAVDKKIISQKEADDYLRLTENENSKIPDAPFKTSWPDLAFKRMLHKAAVEGYDAVSWTPGEAQAARYDLSKQIKEMGVSKNSDGTYSINAITDRGMVTVGEKIKREKLSETVGKEMAEKIDNQKEGFKQYSNMDLKIGGEGMKSFYDKMLVDKANALAKKFGGKVESKEIETNRGFPSKFQLIAKNGDHIRDFDTRQDAMAWAHEQGIYNSSKIRETPAIKPITQPIHVLKLTPELKARAKQGFPLFSGTPILNPVDFNPFEQQQSNYKLTPVQGNPFQ